MGWMRRSPMALRGSQDHTCKPWFSWRQCWQHAMRAACGPVERGLGFLGCAPDSKLVVRASVLGVLAAVSRTDKRMPASPHRRRAPKFDLSCSVCHSLRSSWPRICFKSLGATTLRAQTKQDAQAMGVEAQAAKARRQLVPGEMEFAPGLLSQGQKQNHLEAAATDSGCL